MPKILKTGSVDIMAEGVMRIIDPHMPRVQVSEISDDDLRFQIFITSGILNSGIIMLAARPRVAIKPFIFIVLFLVNISGIEKNMSI